jgi:hypothetical protein
MMADGWRWTVSCWLENLSGCVFDSSTVGLEPSTVEKVREGKKIGDF